MTISRMFGTVRPITNVKMHGPAGVTFESPAYGDLGVAAGAGFMHMRGYATDVECCTTILEEEGFTPTLAGGIVGMGTLTPKMRKMVDEAMSSAVLQHTNGSNNISGSGLAILNSDGIIAR